MLHSDERTRLNCSIVFVTVFVSSDGNTFRLFTAVDGSDVTFYIYLNPCTWDSKRSHFLNTECMNTSHDDSAQLCNDL